MSNSLATARSSAHGFVLVAYLFAAIVSLDDGIIPAHAAEYDVGSIHIAQPWSRATPKGAKAGAGYMTITNKGTTPDKVSCVSDDSSAQCEIHSMTMEGGVMKMRPVEGGLDHPFQSGGWQSTRTREFGPSPSTSACDDGLRLILQPISNPAVNDWPLVVSRTEIDKVRPFCL